MAITVTDTAPVARAGEILTEEALAFVEELHHRFADERNAKLEARKGRRAEAARTRRLDFLPETAGIRAGDWKVAEAPPPSRTAASR